MSATAALLSAVAARPHQRAGGRLDRQNVQRHRHGHERHRLPRRARRRRPDQAGHPRHRGPRTCTRRRKATRSAWAWPISSPASFATRSTNRRRFSTRSRPATWAGRRFPSRFATTRSFSSGSSAATARTAGSSSPTRCTWKRCTRARILRDELAANPICEVEPQPVELTFRSGRHQLSFNGA